MVCGDLRGLPLGLSEEPKVGPALLPAGKGVSLCPGPTEPGLQALERVDKGMFLLGVSPKQ